MIQVTIPTRLGDFLKLFRSFEEKIDNHFFKKKRIVNLMTQFSDEITEIKRWSQDTKNFSLTYLVPKYPMPLKQISEWEKQYGEKYHKLENIRLATNNVFYLLRLVQEKIKSRNPSWSDIEETLACIQRILSSINESVEKLKTL